MNDINIVSITGNLAADPELRATTSGTSVLNFRIASNYSVKNKTTGEWEERPNWVGCVVMGARAEPLSKLLGKGDKVAVSGSLRYHAWEDKEGGKHSVLEVYADNVILMSKRGKSASEAPQHAVSQANPAQSVYDTYPEDLPF